MSVFRTARALRARSAPVELYGGEHSYPYRLIARLDTAEQPVPSPIASSFRKNPIPFGPLWRIAFRMGGLPVKVYSRNGAIKTEEPDHPAYALLRKPNPEIARNIMISGTVMTMFIYKKAGWIKVRDHSGAVTELWPIPGGSLTVKRSKRDLIDRFEVTDPAGGAPIPIRKQDVCYFRLVPDPDDWTDGITPFDPLAVIAALGDEAINAARDQFINGILGRLWAEYEDELGTKAFNRLQAQIEEVVEKRFGVPIFEYGVKLHELQGPKDDVLVSAMNKAKEIIADVLGVDSSDLKQFYSEAIAPVADSIEQELERSLMPEFEQQAFPEFGFREILRGDAGERATLHQTRVLSGQETPNEARADENRPPLDGGDVLFVPLNLVPIDDAPVGGTPRATDTGGGLGGDEGKGTVAAARALSGRTVNTDSWGTLRSRTIRAQARALSRRLGGHFGNELKSIRSIGKGRAARAAELPTVGEIRDAIRDHDPEIAQLLDAYMRSIGSDAADNAAALMGIDVPDPAFMDRVFARRAEQVTGFISDMRSEKVISIVRSGAERGLSVRAVSDELQDTYRTMQTSLAEGIARSELAWAHEQMALFTWDHAGVTELDVVKGPGVCRTGVCNDNAGTVHQLGERMENIGYSFSGATAPPFHTLCNCFAVPTIPAVLGGQ